MGAPLARQSLSSFRSYVLATLSIQPSLEAEYMLPRVGAASRLAFTFKPPDKTHLAVYGAC